MKECKTLPVESVCNGHIFIAGENILTRLTCQYRYLSDYGFLIFPLRIPKSVSTNSTESLKS